MIHIRKSEIYLSGVLALATILLTTSARISFGELYINEIYFDPPGSGDSTQEYVELRGTPSMSLANHYLIFLENENDSQNGGTPSEIEFMFDLNGRSLSPTGFLTFRQKGHPYSNVPADDFNLVNTGSGASWGTAPANNTLGVSSTGGVIENSGFTAMLIRNDGPTAPSLGMLLDGSDDNNGDEDDSDWDGLDYLDTSGSHWVIDNTDANINWTVLDSIGIFSETDESVFGRTYAKYNFGPEADGQNVIFFEQSTGQLINQVFHPNITDDQTYVDVGYEIEYVGRWGNSTGETDADWHISNLTNEPLAGFVSAADGFRQSGSYHDDQDTDFVETNQFVPYGANMTDTLGGENYPLNLASLPWDYNGDGKVSAADYTVWRDTLGSTTDLRADGNNGKDVEEDDYLFWRGRYGLTVGSFGAGSGSFSVTIPEPTGLTLVALGGIVLLARKLRISGQLT